MLGEWLVRGLNGFAWPATWMAVRRPLASDVKCGYLFPYGNWRERIAVHRFVRDIPIGDAGGSAPVLAALTAQLPRLAAKKALLLWGGEDFCFKRFFFDRWRGYLPEAESYYFGMAGHYLLEDAGGEVARKVDTFLSAKV
jgi:haloalkane dehalogenase